MYVDFDHAQATAKHITGIRQWITNEFHHSGLRDDGQRILEFLMAFSRGMAPLS